MGNDPQHAWARAGVRWFAVVALAATGMASATVARRSHVAERATEDLIGAVVRSDCQRVRALLDAGGDPDTPSGLYRVTPLQFAARQGDRCTLDALVQGGALLNARDRAGATALFYAATGDDPAWTVARLLELGADATLRNELGLSAGELTDDPRAAALLTEATRR